MLKNLGKLLFVFLLSTIHCPLSTVHSFGAEIRLKSVSVHCSQTLVTLGDVADIVPTGNDAGNDRGEQLRQAVLFTAPAVGEKRTLDHNELRDILSRIGFSSLKHQLTGAARIVIVNGNAADAVTDSVTDSVADSAIGSGIVPVSYNYDKTANNFVIRPVANVTPSNMTPMNRVPSANPLRKETVTTQLVKTLQQQLAEAIAVYLNHFTAADSGKVTKSPWKITVTLSPEQAKILATSGQIEEIIGGTSVGTNAPVGQQRFGIRMQGLDPTTQQNVVVTVDAVVELPQEVVVLRRSLPRGYIISESDVVLKYVDNLKDDNFYVNIADVAGLETTNSVRELSVLTPGMTKKPTWVHKGDIVTVRLLNNGISVRTEGIAQNDGTQGDTIPVETITPNAKRSRTAKAETSTFLARVCEPKTVEVFASGIIVE